MALIECSECKEKISSNAAFCPHCGNPREKQKALKEDKKEIKQSITCPNCGFNNKKDSEFCIKCGNNLKGNKVICNTCGYSNEEGVIFCNNCGQKLKKEKPKGWNFNNTFLAITFILSAIFGVLVFGSDYFREQAWFIRKIFIFSNEFLAILTISIAVVIFLVALIKDKYSITKEIDHLKHCKLSKIQAGIIFLLAGVLILCHVGLTTYRTDPYIICGFIFTVSFLSMTITALILNYRYIGFFLDGLILVGAIASFIGAGMLYDEAGDHTGSWYDELRHIYEGTSSESQELQRWGNILMLIGFLLTILFITLIIIRIVKYTKRKNSYTLQSTE